MEFFTGPPLDPKRLRLGLGMAALGRPGYINLGHAEDLQQNYDQQAMEAHAHKVLDLAWESGLRYFDTARSYGLGELFLGNWLINRQAKADEVLISSKWGYTYTADWQVEATHHEVKEHSLPVLQRQWQESQAILGTYLDLYQIHSATFESGVLENVEVLTELARLKSEGVAIGLSCSGPNQGEVIQRALEIEIDGQALFNAVQATYNVLERSAGPVLASVAKEGLAIIIKEAVANGRLTARNTDPAFAPKMQELQTISTELGCTVDALALAAILHEPWVDQVLSGAATQAHLLSNIKAADISLSADMIERLGRLQEPPEVYWATRKSLKWN